VEDKINLVRNDLIVIFVDVICKKKFPWDLLPLGSEKQWLLKRIFDIITQKNMGDHDITQFISESLAKFWELERG
jgi:hypothetical protein